MLFVAHTSRMASLLRHKQRLPGNALNESFLDIMRGGSAMKRALAVSIQFVGLLMLVAFALAGCGSRPTPPPPPPPISEDAYGVAWGSSFYRDEQSQLPTQRAADLGARWDRWPFQWNVIEISPGNLSWSGPRLRHGRSKGSRHRSTA